jgi:D-glycero-alpha-D-manno-heptose 1-phosphate guanylyltransferase
MIKEAIIIAGGLGTRLQSIVPDKPKCMAEVQNRPFIGYVIDYLRMQGIERIIFSLGYKYEQIEDFLKAHYATLNYTLVVENEPLGTGGAIQLALTETDAENILIVNGDTLFKVDLNEMASFHIINNAECTLALKPMKEISRYGVVAINDDGLITSFKEKQHNQSGNINGGVYILNKALFLSHNMPDRFSFEKDYLEAFVHKGNFYGCIQNDYFIDIGIPDDYNKAWFDFKRTKLDLKEVNQNWTLFLDRDGVINDERINEYVLNWEQFHFSKGVPEALKILAGTFGRIIIISNQRGVGKQLMTEDDLISIHAEMKKQIIENGGRIESIYYCTDKNDKNFYRKPNPGMAFKAKKDFPGIDFEKSIMIGNKPSDMRFGRNAGMYTVYLTTTNPETPFPHPDIDLQYAGLLDFALNFKS